MKADVRLSEIQKNSIFLEPVFLLLKHVLEAYLKNEMVFSNQSIQEHA